MQESLGLQSRVPNQLPLCLQNRVVSCHELPFSDPTILTLKEHARARYLLADHESTFTGSI